MEHARSDTAMTLASCVTWEMWTCAKPDTGTFARAMIVGSVFADGKKAIVSLGLRFGVSHNLIGMEWFQVLPWNEKVKQTFINL